MKTTKKQHRNLVCGPKTRKKKIKSKWNTCYQDKDLIYLKEQWNIRNPQQTIQSNDSRNIWNSLKKYMKGVCEHERCWLSTLTNNLHMQTDIQQRFAPMRPESWNRNQTEWLSNHDIKRVMNQYEYWYPEFTFIGPSPINYDDNDFDGTCVWDELCNFSLKRYIGKKKYIGIVFNTDRHTGPGKHWIALFVNLKNEYIYYFDSGKKIIPSYVQKLIHTIKQQGQQYNIRFKVKQNKVQHQKGDSECGMYCLHFIISLLENKPLSYFNKRIPDSKVFSMRNVYFNKP
jgi:hypothetical protein